MDETIASYEYTRRFFKALFIGLKSYNKKTYVYKSHKKTSSMMMAGVSHTDTFTKDSLHFAHLLPSRIPVIDPLVI